MTRANSPPSPAKQPVRPAELPDVRRRRTMLILCPFPTGVAAGQRLKYEQYLANWERAGWNITISSFMDRDLWHIVYEPGRIATKIFGTIKGIARRWRDILRVRSFDVVYVFMNVTPVGTSAPERLVAALAKRLVYDIEDNMLYDGKATAGINALTRWVRKSSKALALLRPADAVITASPFMAARYRSINRAGECVMIPPSVDTDRFFPGQRDPSAVPVIGWTGTFSSEPYLDLLRPMLQKLAQQVDFKLRVIGNFDYALTGVDFEVVRWTEEREVADMQAIDIGLYPLPDDDWVLGKAGLKVIQYMAFGIPSVSSNVGTAMLQVRHGETGFLANNDEEWLTQLEMLVRDPALRARVGAAARGEAVKHYSRQAVAGQYQAVLDRVLP